MCYQRVRGPGSKVPAEVLGRRPITPQTRSVKAQGERLSSSFPSHEDNHLANRVIRPLCARCALRRTAEVRKEGENGEQTFQILCLLLERPGDVVSGEELRAKLWADDTFVDFDHGLNSAIQRSRDSLSDSAGKPRWVETLPRRGYCFVGQVEWSERAAANGGTVETPQAESTASADRETAREQKTAESAPTGSVFRHWCAGLVASLVLLLVASAAVGILLRRGGRHEAEMRRLSFGRGMIRSARFASDGTDVIYSAAWDGKPFQMFSVRQDGTESHSLSQQSLDILAVSVKGKLAVVLDRRFSIGFQSSGTLGSAHK